jgi:hypothetical protein
MKHGAATLAEYEKGALFCFAPFPHESCSLWYSAEEDVAPKSVTPSTRQWSLKLDSLLFATLRSGIAGLCGLL